ncbi:MAG TPA: helix-turn-helix domain-containing protein [Caulobacteraceae bacterium]|jgi:excisionase family DNA binding protein|nr:helix-turn-helix domain-containing protein [Caulobacteraceae bacterium]
MAAKVLEPSALRPRAYRVGDFCKAFGIGRSLAYELMSSGELPSIKVGRRRLIPADAAENLIKGAR